MRQAAACLFRASALATMLIAAMAACDGPWRTVAGSGNPVQITRDAGPFTSVAFSVPGELVLEQGPSTGLSIDADDNLLEHLVVRVRGGRLEIGTQGNVRLRPSAPLRFHVRTPTLDDVRVAGSGSVEIREFDVDRLRVRVAGSGGATASDLRGDLLDAEVAGSGRFEAWGTVDRKELSIAGSGVVDAADLDSRVASIEIAGSGSAVVRVSEELSVRIAGSGTVRYAGEPHVSTSIAGSGTVARRD